MNARTKDQLIAYYKIISRRLADETLSEIEAACARNELEQIKAEIEANSA